MDACCLNLKKANLAVVYGQNQGWCYQHAAEEFAHYIKEMSGTEVPVFSDTAKEVDHFENVVLIGDESTNQIISNLVKDKEIGFLKVNYGADNFIMKSFTKGGKHYLILGGGTGRSTLYAVYDYFERFCNVGYFWDGDNIPKCTEIPFFDIDVYEEPAFKWRSIRYFGHWGLKRFHPKSWNLEDWKNEMDWLIKNKFNMFHLEWGIPEDDLLQIAFPEVEYPPPGISTYDVIYGHPEIVDVKARDVSHNYFPGTWVVPLQYGRKLRQDVISYARKRGLVYVNEAGFNTWVPRQYAEKHPEQHFLQDKKQYLSFVVDPYFTEGWEFVKKMMKASIELYGTDHIYCGLPLLGEVNYGAEKGYDVLDFKKLTLKKVDKIIHDLDPVGIFNLQGWDFGCETWGPRTEDIREAIRLLSPDLSYIEDLWCDYGARETYRDWGFFDGRPWGMTVLHSLAMADELHGDRQFIIDRVKRVFADPNKGKFIGLGFLPELQHYDTMYAQLIAKLAWNPQSISSLEDFLRWYVLRRYGRDVSANMLRSMKELCEATKQYQWGATGEEWCWGGHRRYYSTLFSGALFHSARNTENVIRVDKLADAASRHFKESLSYALSEKERLKDNKMYETDVVDIARSLISDLIGIHLGRAYLAYEGATVMFNNKQDAKLFVNAFELEAVTVKRLIKALENLLSTREDFYLQKTIDEIMSVDGTNPVGPYIIKSNQETPYNRSQVYELVTTVYKRDVDAYLDLLRKHLNSKDTEFVSVNDPEFKARLNEHHHEFLEKPLNPQKTYKGTPLDAAQDILDLAKELIPPFTINLEKVPSANRCSQDEATIRVTVESSVPHVTGSIILGNPMSSFISEPKEYSMDLVLGRWKTSLYFDVKVGVGTNLLFTFVNYSDKQYIKAEVVEF
jgi:hypothetical protein